MAAADAVQTHMPGTPAASLHDPTLLLQVDQGRQPEGAAACVAVHAEASESSVSGMLQDCCCAMASSCCIPHDSLPCCWPSMPAMAQLGTLQLHTILLLRPTSHHGTRTSTMVLVLGSSANISRPS
jgi:hypothetical protein